jgi:Rad3-related DNA helicase
LSCSRVAELEQENAALRALAQNGSSGSHPKKGRSEDELLSEIEQLRDQLAAAGERELELSAELERQAESRHAAIKLEAAEPHFPPSMSRTAPVSSPHKPAASLGLMVSEKVGCSPVIRAK